TAGLVIGSTNELVISPAAATELHIQVPIVNNPGTGQPGTVSVNGGQGSVWFEANNTNTGGTFLNPGSVVYFNTDLARRPFADNTTVTINGTTLNTQGNGGDGG